MYEKLNLLAKSLVSRIVGQVDEIDPATLSRLQQIKDRLASQTGGDVDADGYMTARLRHTAEGEANGDPAITHWCRESGRYQKQSIRRGEELRGAQQCFEIDPISNLTD